MRGLRKIRLDMTIFKAGLKEERALSTERRKSNLPLHVSHT
jgi:hypothetical protein